MLRTQGLSRNYWKEGMFSRFSIQNAVSSPLIVLVYGSTRAFIQLEFNKCTGVRVLFRLTELLKESCIIHVCTQPHSANSSELSHRIVKVFWFGVKHIQRRNTKQKGVTTGMPSCSLLHILRANDYQYLIKPIST